MKLEIDINQVMESAAVKTAVKESSAHVGKMIAEKIIETAWTELNTPEYQAKIKEALKEAGVYDAILKATVIRTTQHWKKILRSLGVDSDET